MYNVSYFKEKDLTVIKTFMRQNPFAMVCGCNAEHKPVATQVPLLMEEKDGKLFLYGHIQRKTDHHLAFEYNPDVLAVFTGPHTYVSASWYSDPQVASTWNYMAVHARGRLQFLDDAGLLTILSRLTSHFENNAGSPALVEKMPQEYMQKMMKAIVAFEIEVTHLDHVFKLSQNRDKKNYESVITHLEQGDDASKQVASAMKERASQLFNKEVKD